MKLKIVASLCKKIYLKIKNQHYGKQLKGFFMHADEYRQTSSLKKIYVVSTPEYGNLGDHAIAIAEMSLLREFYPDYKVVEIGDDEFLYHYRCLCHFIKKVDIICLIGGGNFGVIYPEVEFVRRKMIKGCPNNKIIMFPQTMDFGSGKYAEKELRKSKQLYQKHRELYLMAREKRSYKMMQKEFSKNRVLLAPDVVLTWKPKIKSSVTNNLVLLCLRDDKERAMNSEVRDAITVFLKSKGYQIFYADTEQHRRIAKDDRKKEVDAMLEKIATAQFMITDRLHGMIFSCICGTPCLAFDNNNKKISGVAEWIHNQNISVYRDNVSIEEQIMYISQKSHFVFNNNEYVKMFSDALKDVI